MAQVGFGGDVGGNPARRREFCEIINRQRQIAEVFGAFSTVALAYSHWPRHRICIALLGDKAMRAIDDDPFRT
jgi:hypothetical protein